MYPFMPYGLCNSPSVFQSFINELLSDMPYLFVIAYIDNILIYSERQEHIEHVRQVLQHLRLNQLNVKSENSIWPHWGFSGMSYPRGSGYGSGQGRCRTGLAPTQDYQGTSAILRFRKFLQMVYSEFQHCGSSTYRPDQTQREETEPGPLLAFKDLK